MKKIFDQVDQFFFKKASAYHLSCIRIITALFLLVFCERYFDGLEIAYSAGNYDAVGLFKILPTLIDLEFLRSIQVVWLVSLLFLLFGFLTRFSTILVFLTSLFVLGYRNNFGKIDHDSHLLLYMLFVFCFSRWGDVFSIDSLFRPKKPVSESWRYRWPVALINITTVLTMFTLGVQKLYFEGLEWVFSDKFYLLIYKNPGMTVFGKFILNQDLWVSVALAFYSVFVVECLSPLALSKKFSKVFPVLWSSLHVGVWLILGGHLNFFSQVVVYLNFYDLSFFPKVIAKRLGAHKT